jgi:hypothetical protein
MSINVIFIQKLNFLVNCAFDSFGWKTRTTPVQYARIAQWAYDWQWVAGLRYDTWQG